MLLLIYRDSLGVIFSLSLCHISVEKYQSNHHKSVRIVSAIINHKDMQFYLKNFPPLRCSKVVHYAKVPFKKDSAALIELMDLCLLVFKIKDYFLLLKRIFCLSSLQAFFKRTKKCRQVRASFCQRPIDGFLQTRLLVFYERL